MYRSDSFIRAACYHKLCFLGLPGLWYRASWDDPISEDVSMLKPKAKIGSPMHLIDWPDFTLCAHAVLSGLSLPRQVLDFIVLSREKELSQS